MSTIVAISTASGIGGIGIIRMSGDECFVVLNKIFKQKNYQELDDIKGYTIKYGDIYEGESRVDEVLVSYFKGTKSYTAENMCEINCHGGNVVMQKILELCLKNGAVLAEAGEFTKRAFLNGRIDLLQAESVIDIINAKSVKESQASMLQLNGFLSQKIGEIKAEILKVMINIEVEIDYPEYDVEETNIEELVKMLEYVKRELEILEKSFENGKIIKDGVKTAIIGKPNAGKSSLLNRLLKEERAIVTSVEGTTRDTIEEYINIEGVPLKLIDTAGIRVAKDEVEKIGIEKAKTIANEADLLILILDATKKLDDEDFEMLELAKTKKSIILLNKMDLGNDVCVHKNEFLSTSEYIIELSTLKGEGIHELEDVISKMFKLSEINFDNELVVTNIRHKNIISQALENIKEANESVDKKMTVDIIAIHIKSILENLSSITGENVTEDLIDEIFAKFCLGK